jgi:hypothetical protein
MYSALVNYVEPPAATATATALRRECLITLLPLGAPLRIAFRIRNLLLLAQRNRPERVREQMELADNKSMFAFANRRLAAQGPASYSMLTKLFPLWIIKGKR